MSPVAVRPIAAEDSLELLTDLIHAAYAPHAARGLRYWGTHQTVEDTAKRFASGHGFIAEVDGKILGTITLRGPQPQSPVAVYRESNTWSIGQFAVMPSHQGQGVGLALHDYAVAFAVASGAQHMAIDTASTASALIAKYEAWGYEFCGLCDWRPHTNYLSVLMSRPLIKK
jgi:GNAT superfamily N-acetyltransferase